MNMFVWNRLKEKAATLGERGYLMRMADARFHVMRICREVGTEYPSLDTVEHLASELVRLSLEARNRREPRLRSSYREITELPEGVSL